MSSKDFAYYVKDLPDEDQKAVQEYATEGTIDLIQVGTKWQIADALTKWLPRPRFEFLRGYLLGTSTFDHSKYPTRSH